MLGISSFVAAQINRAEGSLGIASFNGQATITVKGDKLIVSKSDATDTFALVKDGTTNILAQDADSSAIYNRLEITPLQLNKTLAEQAGANAIAKLIDIASRMQGQQLKLVSADENALSYTDSIEEGATPAVEVAEANNNSWMIPALIGLAALIIGIILGRVSKKSANPSITYNTPELPKTTPVAPAEEQIVKVDTKQTAQLKKDLAAALEQNKLITDKTKKLIDGDSFYYNAVFEKLILPLQTALDNGDEAAVVKYAHLAMVHLSSITRVKIQKKQKYDDANIQLITGNASLTQEFPQIDGQTPIDKIPANIRVLMNILQKNGVNGLDDTVIKGYKLKQL
jgi:hypothetical protein